MYRIKITKQTKCHQMADDIKPTAAHMFLCQIHKSVVCTSGKQRDHKSDINSFPLSTAIKVAFRQVITTRHGHTDLVDHTEVI